MTTVNGADGRAIRPLRVAMVNLTSGGLSGGYRKYITEIVPGLRADRRIDELVVINPPAQSHLADWSWPTTDPRRGYRATKQYIADFNADVVFIPTSRLLKVRGIPTVTMVRNMEPLVMPFAAPTIKERLVNLARLTACRWSSHSSDRVIAVSEFVRQHLVARWRVSAGRVGTVPHGVDRPTPGNGQQPSGLTDASGVRLFSAGSIRPARGIEDLLGALARLKESALPVELWFAGKATPGAERYFASLRDSAQRLGIADRVRWLGDLAPPQMQWCFENASAFIMTSRVEACPNLVLESMSHGALCVSTTDAPMPEFYGDAVYGYYRAGDAAELAAIVARLAAAGESDPEVARARRAASERVKSFTWAKTVDRTIEELMFAVASVQNTSGRSTAPTLAT